MPSYGDSLFYKGSAENRSIKYIGFIVDINSMTTKMNTTFFFMLGNLKFLMQKIVNFRELLRIVLVISLYGPKSLKCIKEKTANNSPLSSISLPSFLREHTKKEDRCRK